MEILCFFVSPPQIFEVTHLGSLIDIQCWISAAVYLSNRESASNRVSESENRIKFLYVDTKKTAERTCTVMMVSRCKMLCLGLSGRRQDMFIPDKQI